jgi:hypothetical protein
MLSHPWYAVIVVLHVLVGVIGFGALGLTGSYARLAAKNPNPYASEVLRRYFRPGNNLGARMIYLVPVFGLIALAFSGDTGKLYPYIGLGIWTAALGVATSTMWPNEIKIQRLMADGEGDKVALVKAAKLCETGAMITTLLFICALVVMIGQPN